jgi:anti-anti-sigma factor
MPPAAIEVLALGPNALRLVGELDLDTSPVLEQALEVLDGAVTLDLSTLTLMDSSGLRVILNRALETPVTIIKPRRSVRKVFEVAGVLDVDGRVIQPGSGEEG